MGQKIHPVGLRLGITRTWDSRWFEKKHYQEWLHEDWAIRKYFVRWMRPAAISKIEIERRTNQVRVIVHTAKPGIIIGKRGVGIEDIRQSLEKLTGKTVQVNVMEIKHLELDARLVGQNIVDQLEKRIAFRRAMKQAIMRSMKAGARGIKVQCSGRLGGAEIARTERNHDGKVPLHTLRADIDYANVEAFTTFGRIGVKVWIYRGEVLPDQPRTEQARPAVDRGDRATFRDQRTRAPRGAARPARPVEMANATQETPAEQTESEPVILEQAAPGPEVVENASQTIDAQQNLASESVQESSASNAVVEDTAPTPPMPAEADHSEPAQTIAVEEEAWTPNPEPAASQMISPEAPAQAEPTAPSASADTSPIASESDLPKHAGPQGEPHVSAPTTESAE